MLLVVVGCCAVCLMLFFELSFGDWWVLFGSLISWVGSDACIDVLGVDLRLDCNFVGLFECFGVIALGSWDYVDLNVIVGIGLRGCFSFTDCNWS